MLMPSLQLLRRAAAAAVLLAAVTACRPPGVADETAPPGNPKALEPGIIRSVDLLKVPGVGLMQRMADAQPDEFLTPNLRGPCGGVVEQPEVRNRLVAVFLGESSALTEAIVQADESDAEKVMEGIRKDIRPDCEPQTAVAPDGTSQTYVQGPIVDVGEVGDDRIATRATLEIREQTIYLGTILIRNGGTMIQALFSSQTPVAEETVAGLARLMDEASRNLRDGGG